MHRPASVRRIPPSTVTADDLVLQEQLDQLEHRFAELREQVRRAQKMASLGRTAAMLAHEFNNLFTPVVAYAQYALDNDDVDMMRKALEKTLSRTAIVREIAQRIVGFARDHDSGLKTVGLRELVDDAITCLGRDPQKDRIEVTILIDDALKVRANPNQLQQVLFNLVLNAREAMLGRAGRLTIDAEPTGDGFVAVHVRDTGCGIRPEDLGRIFEPFYSTKQAGRSSEAQGLGLGLAVCRDIAEEHGGTLTAESTPDVGTTFTLRLPTG